MSRSRLCASAVVLFVFLVNGCAPGPAAGRSGLKPAPRPLSGAVNEKYFRDPRGSIFAPLDLPTPGAERSASGAPGPGYWQQRVDYQIEAELYAPEKAEDGSPGLTGHEVMTYTNNSPEALPYLWIHLEQNLYLPDSIGAQANAPDEAPGESTGGITILGVLVDGAEAHLAVYDTLGRIDLPAPVAALGGQVSIEIAWSFAIPANGSERMGVEDCEQGRVFELGQWFPAACVFDDVNGWNTLPYMGNGEFYTDFGDYDVSLTVPSSHIVAATGILQNPREVLTSAQIKRLAEASTSRQTVQIRTAEEVADASSRPDGDEPLTWQFKAENCRTFAWASSKAFIWDAAHVTECGPDGAGTLVQSLYPKEGIELWPRATDMACRTLEFYGRMWAPYPYPVATNINGNTYGMEYPMIVFCSDREEERELYYTTTHEFGHEWFPMMVSSDERRYPWMDEGLNTFMNYYSLLDRYGRGYDDLDIAAFAAQFGPTQDQPVLTWHDRMWRGQGTYLGYDKPAWAMICLREQVLGPERFDPAFREYVRRWSFKHPQPADFFRTMENAAGMDLTWFWRGWFFETGWLDQEVTAVKKDSKSGEARATFTNRGRIVMPVDYLVSYNDGSTERRRLPAEAWATTDQWTVAWDTNGRTVVRLVVDPDGKLPDVDRSNNTWGR